MNKDTMVRIHVPGLDRDGQWGKLVGTEDGVFVSGRSTQTTRLYRIVFADGKTASFGRRELRFS